MSRLDFPTAATLRTSLLRFAMGPRYIDPQIPRGREVSIAGARVLVTGASSGIGRAAAVRLGELGAEVLLVARRAEELEAVRSEIVRSGGTANCLACDITDQEAVTRLTTEVESKWGAIDVLINNAGRSIRRSVVDSLDRFHDYERTMAVNYFGTVRLTTSLLPAMLERGSGQIVNVGTWGVVMGTMPKFAAYGASKSAIAAFARSLGAEIAGRGITVTTVHYPLVHTPMSNPTEEYRREAAGLTPTAAAEWLIPTLQRRPVVVYPRGAALARTVDAFRPSLVDRALMTGS
ncbi:SDR family NAD(P)-dependent oxidoreductase [Nocardia sp. CC201C]|uniref:SDR family NAD(P)-dependent oxidoreductase n=1 Tax=Nocardia sp. CC201C TaxID=3044575 RepID=UPI0024A80879|nr:SDR family NAD(P)-dependent oxidoreductase [Nocardia sp. CC201C]